MLRTAPVHEVGVADDAKRNLFEAYGRIFTPCRRTQKTQHGIETLECFRSRLTHVPGRRTQKTQHGIETRRKKTWNDSPRSQNPENPARD